MPELCRFYGISIRIDFRDHNPPHFHALYGEHEAENSTSAYPFIRPSDIERLELFVRGGEAIRESRTLAALRDTLLPKLVSGELSVACRGGSRTAPT